LVSGLFTVASQLLLKILRGNLPEHPPTFSDQT